MTAKNVNLILWLVAAIFSLAAVGSLLFGIAWPLEDDRQSVGTGGRAAATQPSTGIALPPLAAYEKLWAMQLRRNLGEALPPSTRPSGVASAEGSTPIQVTLVGTIGTSLALLKTAGNTVEVRGVGESLNGVTVLAVRPAEVDVRFNGQVLKLAKAPEAR
jgi:hypothetical protein